MGQEIVAWIIAHLPFGAQLSGVFLLMGVARGVFKLATTFLDNVVSITPTKYDDDLLASWEHSKIYTLIAYLLDFFASIKLPAKSEEPKV